MGRNLFATTPPSKGRNLFSDQQPVLDELSALSTSKKDVEPFRFQNELDQIRKDRRRAEFQARSQWEQAGKSVSDIADTVADDLTFGYGAKAAAALYSPFTDKSYGQELNKLRTEIDRSKERAGLAGVAASVATSVKALPQAAMEGAGWLYRAGAGALEGAGYGALDAGGHDKDVAEGAGWGAALGGGSSLAIDAAGGAKNAVRDLVRKFRAEPSERAKLALYQAASKIGLTPQMIDDQIAEHGPELMAVDVLGKHGTSIGRAASNVSPEARTTLETATADRKAMQNPRVVSTLEDASGLPRGTRQTVDTLKRDLYEPKRPAIDAAYEEARASGYDLPREPFRDIIESPMGGQAYDRAGDSLLNFKATRGIDATSELARLDQAKQELDSIAEVAARQGDNTRAAQASGMARKLREQMDASIAGPEYETARGLRKSAYETDEAVDLGQGLAGGRIPLDMPGQARSVTDEANRDALAKAYALQQSENLLNKSNTEGALSAMRTPMGQEATAAALSPEGAAAVASRLGTESLFNQTHRELTGNSSTMRQLMEAGGGAALGSSLAGALGYDPLSGGIAGAGWRAARTMPVIQKYASFKNLREGAPEIAQRLTGSPRDIPVESPFGADPDLLSPQERAMLQRLMMFGGLQATGQD
jgi:hypothetical protein